MTDRNKVGLVNQIIRERSAIRNSRANERDLKARFSALSQQPLINLTDDVENLQSKLARILPKNMVPKNLGPLSQVMWPFWYEFNFDFSDPANLDNALFSGHKTVENTVQVSHEAGFIWTNWYRDFNSSGIVGEGAPLKLTLRDRQSSRQFNDLPVQIQHIGSKGEPTRLPTPLVIMPNARLTIEMESLFGADVSVADGGLNGAAKHRIILSGYRMRMEDAQSVIEQVFL